MNHLCHPHLYRLECFYTQSVEREPKLNSTIEKKLGGDRRPSRRVPAAEQRPGDIQDQADAVGECLGATRGPGDCWSNDGAKGRPSASRRKAHRAGNNLGASPPPPPQLMCFFHCYLTHYIHYVSVHPSRPNSNNNGTTAAAAITVAV